MADNSVEEGSFHVEKGYDTAEVINNSLCEGPLPVVEDAIDNANMTQGTSCDPLHQEPLANEKEDSLIGSAPTGMVKDVNGSNADENLIVGDDKTPQVGMIFNSYGEACYFYKQYAQRVGFAATVRRSSFKDNGECLHLILACCRWGKGRGGEEYQSRPTAKTNCQASIKLRLRGEGLLHLEKVNLEHNHELNPSITKVYRCFKILSNNKVLRPKSSHNLGQAHAHENYACSDKEHKISTLKFGQGAYEAIQEFFTRMQNKNSHFFYLIDLNEEGCLCNVFWADYRSKLAYKYFGDVISFDTTYLTGMYEIPLVLFIGANNHGQPVLLGCGFLSGESIENFIWVFKAWLSCMSGKSPDAVVTDHCKAIQGAVSEVFLGVRHRLCLYDIMKKVPEKLRDFSAYKEIEKALKKAVYDSTKGEEFEENWRNIIEKYTLQGCEWLESLYKSRHSWVPVFLKDTFWAGLSISQRGECVTPYFDGYINSKTTLRRFFSIYEAALQSKYEKDVQADSDSFHGYWRLVSKFYMEEQLSKLYTLNMFKLFQAELKATMYCDVSLVKVDGVTSIFEVKESVFLEGSKKTKNKDYEVNYVADELKVLCICGYFQFRGILCRHALAVLKFQQVYEIPSHYILGRWRKDYKRLHALAQSCNDVVSKNVMERDDHLSMRCLQLLEVGLISDDKYQKALKLITEVEKHLLDDSPQMDEHQKITLVGSQNINGGDLDTLQFGLSRGDWAYDSSQPIKRRGRPPKKRKEVETEAIARLNNGANSSVALVGNQNNVLGVGTTCPRLGTYSGTQGVCSPMEDVNLNNLSSHSHFGLRADPQHHLAELSGMHLNMIQNQYRQQNVGDHQSRTQWLYHQMLQEYQLPRAPHPD